VSNIQPGPVRQRTRCSGGRSQEQHRADTSPKGPVTCSRAEPTPADTASRRDAERRTAGLLRLDLGDRGHHPDRPGTSRITNVKAGLKGMDPRDEGRAGGRGCTKVSKRGKLDRTLLVEHPKPERTSSLKVVDTDKPTEEDGGAFLRLFTVPIKPGRRRHSTSSKRSGKCGAAVALSNRRNKQGRTYEPE